MLKEEMVSLWPKVVAFGTAALGAMLVIIAFWVAGNIVRKIIIHIAEKDRERHEVLMLMANASRVIIVGFGVVSGLGTVGVDISAMIAGLGLTGFALGFALKDMLSSAVAGLMILLNRPFRIGDRVSITDIKGSVMSIDLRYTTLDDGEKRVLIPNATVLNSPVTVMNSPSPSA